MDIDEQRATADATPGQPESTHDARTPDGGAVDRRAFIRGSARRLAYLAPMVLLFRPKEALAQSGGSVASPGP